MTRKLYYEESYLEVFEAGVIACEETQGGYLVVLDQTAFYPGGGGQLCDTGTLEGDHVLEVFEKEAVIYHKVERFFEVGVIIKGRVDIKRRIDFMVQHTGEHIVSGVIDKLYGYANVGFHLAKDYMTADFDGELDAEQLEEIERLANEAVGTHQKVTAQVYSPMEIEEIAYRSKKVLQGDIRLVRAGEYDCCACCGTHVKTISEVGMIKIIQADRHRGGMRLVIVCGERARKYFSRTLDELKTISDALSAKIGCVSEGVQRIQQEVAQLKQTLAVRSQEYFRLKAQCYHYDRPLFLVEETIQPQEMKYFAEALMPHIKDVVFVVVPRAEDIQYMVISKERDIRPFVKQMNASFQGKGGGKPTFCQGSIKGDVKDIEAMFEAYYPSWVTEIEKYVPYNEQEATDQKIILEYISQFGDTLTRENEMAHLTSSAWIVNKERTKVLMAYHNIYDNWAWTGGHSDGDGGHLQVAIREAMEETGVKQIETVSEALFSIEVLPVPAHMKKGKFISSHLHLSLAYLVEVDENQELVIKADENSAVKWIPLEEVHECTKREPLMQKVYAKFIEKMKAYV